MGHMIAPGPLIDGNTQVRNFIKEVLDCSAGTVHRKDELLGLDKRLADGREFSGNRYFWNSEDMVHRRPGYYLGVNISSIRSNGPESVAPFSVVNYHFPFGSMMIKTRGDEYLTSRGGINYSALPGITSDPTAPLPKEETWYGFHGLNDFCGGVSDGDVGVCGFIQKQKEFTATAHKSYFFFDGGLVALGSAISGDHLETTINQNPMARPRHVQHRTDRRHRRKNSIFPFMSRPGFFMTVSVISCCPRRAQPTSSSPRKPDKPAGSSLPRTMPLTPMPPCQTFRFCSFRSRMTKSAMRTRTPFSPARRERISKPTRTLRLSPFSPTLRPCKRFASTIQS